MGQAAAPYGHWWSHQSCYSLWQVRSVVWAVVGAGEPWTLCRPTRHVSVVSGVHVLVVALLW